MHVVAKSFDGKHVFTLTERGEFERLVDEVNDDLLDGTEPYDDESFLFTVSDMPEFFNEDEDIDYSTELDAYLDAFEAYNDGDESFKMAAEWLVEEMGRTFLTAMDEADGVDIYIGDAEDAAKSEYDRGVNSTVYNYVDWYRLGEDEVENGTWVEYNSPHGNGLTCIILNPTSY